MYNYKDLREELLARINKLKNGFLFLMKSEKILELFEKTLAIGNYLNGESNKGGAYGFKIDIIEKASDIKGASISLLKYIIR